jgi:putative ABC transport system permease protein
MALHPILSAMRRNKVGAILIALQMAITLAILCNGLFIIQQRLTSSHRPTGTDEANIFAIDNQWVGNPADLLERLQTDLAALRTLPGVVDAYATNSYPLTNSGWTGGVSLHPDQKHSSARSAMYLVDENGVHTLGLKLIAGRNFSAPEINDFHTNDVPHPTDVIITRTLADKLFPGGNALGQTIFEEGGRVRTLIIGIVEKLQVPWTSATGWGSTFNDNSTLLPLRFVAQGAYYIVRAQPGQIDAVMQAARKKLVEVNRARVLQKIQSLTAARVEAYRDDRGLAVILGVICVALLAVTAFGIVGLTSYWVSQRRRQIGIRRALGATRTAIMRHFQTENLLIAATGVLVGIGLAMALNMWMVRSFEMERLHVNYTLIGAIIVLLLGQIAVLWPALRAASVPPALATRSV